MLTTDKMAWIAALTGPCTWQDEEEPLNRCVDGYVVGSPHGTCHGTGQVPKYKVRVACPAGVNCAALTGLCGGCNGAGEVVSQDIGDWLEAMKAAKWRHLLEHAVHCWVWGLPIWGWGKSEDTLLTTLVAVWYQEEGGPE